MDARKQHSHLRPGRHPQRDFFIADLVDISAKDDMPSMEHPLFALKAGDRRIRRYEHNGVIIEIQPGVKGGLATIHDKDIWIYAVSQLVEGMNRGREDISRTVRFTAYDFLVTTQRCTGGTDYERLSDALNRLAGTRIETNIETNGHRERQGFGLLDSWRVVEKDNDRMVSVEVTLPDWLYRSVLARNVLTISPDYFRLRKAIDRRLYEIARKHCGRQASWKISVSKLHRKSGSTASVREFRRAVRSLASSDQLPEYRLEIDAEGEQVTFRKRRSRQGQIQQLKDVLEAL